MPLFRLAFFGSLPDRTVADPLALEIEQARLVRRCENQAASVRLTGALLMGSPFVAILVEGARSEVNRAFLRFVNETSLSDATVIGAARIPTRAFSTWHAAPVGQATLGAPFRPDLMTLDELTSFAMLAVDDIIDIHAHS